MTRISNTPERMLRRVPPFSFSPFLGACQGGRQILVTCLQIIYPPFPTMNLHDSSTTNLSWTQRITLPSQFHTIPLSFTHHWPKKSPHISCEGSQRISCADTVCCLRPSAAPSRGKVGFRVSRFQPTWSLSQMLQVWYMICHYSPTLGWLLGGNCW